MYLDIEKYIEARKAMVSKKTALLYAFGIVPVIPLGDIPVEKTVTGNPISITDALAQDALSLQVSFTPTQDGTPSIDSEPTTEPYLSKVVPRGNKEYYSLVGATVAWNQLVQNGDFASSSGWSVYDNSKISLNIANGIASTSVLVAGSGGYTYGLRQQNLPAAVKNHKYLLSYSAKRAYSGRLMAMDFDGIGRVLSSGEVTPANVWGNFCAIVNPTVGGRTSIVISPASGTELSIGDTIDYKNVNIIDLTLMFGTTIADYAYTLEQSQAGSGIAWLKSYGFFSKDYYEYSAGELLSVNTSGKKIVGFNQWDEQWEVGRISTSTGANIDSTSAIRSKNFCKIMPNTTYYVKSTLNLIVDVYDENKSFIHWIIWGNENRTITTPLNAFYFKLCTTEGSGNTYNHDICINISDPQKNGTYKPYVTNTYPIQSTDLRGLFKLDVNNKLTCKGDIYPPSGSVSRKYGIVDMGTLGWTYSGSGDNLYFSSGASIANMRDTPDYFTPFYICSKYESKPCIITSSLGDKQLCHTVNANKQVFVKDSDYTDATSFKAAMSGVYLVYELATPITESVTAYTSPIDVEAGGTEEFVDNRTVPIPVGNETYYASEFAVNGKTSVTVSHGATSSDTPTEYEVEFTQQGTVYGGTVDVVTGALTVTWGYTYLNSLNWEASGRNDGLFFDRSAGNYMKMPETMQDVTTAMCQRYPSSSYINHPDKSMYMSWQTASIKYLVIVDSRYADYTVNQFKNAVKDVPLAYELATPLTYQLTPEQVTMLLGNNYLETEDGTLTLTYLGNHRERNTRSTKKFLRSAKKSTQKVKKLLTF